MKLKQKTLYSVLALTVLAIVSVLILAVVNLLTEVNDTELLQQKIAEFYPEATVIADASYDVSGYKNDDYTQILNCEALSDGAVAIRVKSKKAYSADGIELLVFIKDGNIARVSRYKSAETPGIGSKVTSDEYLKRFEGKSVSEFSSFPYGDGVVDAVIGATKTSNGVKYAVGAAADFYRKEVANEK